MQRLKLLTKNVQIIVQNIGIDKNGKLSAKKLQNAGNFEDRELFMFIWRKQ